MREKMKKLVLFDIDGTLIHTGGAGTKSMNLAFNEVFSIKDAFKGISMAGKTDRQIMKEGLGTHGFNDKDGNMVNMVNAYLKFLQIEMDNPRRELKPGIMEILNRTREEKMSLGLLTGNLEQGARIKLDFFGLNKYFPEGAFGSDHEDRDMLLPIVLEKFSRKGLNFSATDCIIIGDTPRDVQCAKIHGALCIAVATGPYSKKDLLNTDADVVFDSLADVNRCMEFINEL